MPQAQCGAELGGPFDALNDIPVEDFRGSVAATAQTDNVDVVAGCTERAGFFADARIARDRVGNEHTHTHLSHLFADWLLALSPSSTPVLLPPLTRVRRVLKRDSSQHQPRRDVLAGQCCHEPARSHRARCP